MESLKRMARCIGLSVNISILRDFYGYRTGAPRELSLPTQIQPYDKRVAGVISGAKATNAASCLINASRKTIVTRWRCLAKSTARSILNTQLLRSAIY